MCRELGKNESTVTEGQVELWEAPWNDSRILKECLCEAHNGPVSFVSVSSTMDIVLRIKQMMAFHDPNHFAFEGRQVTLSLSLHLSHKHLSPITPEKLLKSTFEIFTGILN